MCRRNRNRCLLLGDDPSGWNAYAPLTPDPSLLDGFSHFTAAVNSAALGDVASARAKLAEVDSDAIRTWYIEHAQVAGNARVAALKRASVAPYAGPVDPLAYPRVAVVREVFAADGYRCRYCQRPVVPPDVLKLLQLIVGRNSFSIGPTNLATHGSVIAHRAVVDHVTARKRGGPTQPENLVTACYPCNFGKGDYTLDQLGIAAPRPALRDDWDGLQSLLPELKKVAKSISA